MQLDELSDCRPVIIYITALINRKDFSSQTSKYRYFMHPPSLPDGVLKRDANPYNLCLIEANPNITQLKEQISAAFGEYKEASHKVVILNAHGIPEGVLLKDKNSYSAEVILDGEQLAMLLSPYTDGRNLHVFVFSAHGHIFASQFDAYMSKDAEEDVNNAMAISYFTSKDKPTAWDMVSTAGKRNVVVTSELRDFVKSTIRPNNPYNTLEGKIKP